MRSIPLVLLVASSCVEEQTPQAETPGETAAALQPWEPIDPGFIGCEGG